MDRVHKNQTNWPFWYLPGVDLKPKGETTRAKKENETFFLRRKYTQTDTHTTKLKRRFQGMCSIHNYLKGLTVCGSLGVTLCGFL